VIGYIKVKPTMDRWKGRPCVMRGCNEPPRVEQESAYWGLHTIAERIFPTDFTLRGIETPRSSPVRGSFQRKGRFSTRRYAENARSVVRFALLMRVSQHYTRYVMRENLMKICRISAKNEGTVSRVARSSHLRSMQRLSIDL